MNTVPRQFRRLHIEAEGGVAGDMLLAALLDLGADRAAIERAFASLAEPGLQLGVRAVELNGIRALSVDSVPLEPVPRYRRLAEIEALLERAAAEPRARAVAKRIFACLADAEAQAHDATPEAVVLHEVGQLDSVLDVLGVAVALDSCGMPPASCSPLPIGFGKVRAAHGLMTVPVPAVRAIANATGVPLCPIPVVGETVTPTGIAVIATVCQRYGERPAGEVAVGVGAGKQRFPDRANVVRVFGYVGEEATET